MLIIIKTVIRCEKKQYKCEDCEMWKEGKGLCGPSLPPALALALGLLSCGSCLDEALTPVIVMAAAFAGFSCDFEK